MRSLLFLCVLAISTSGLSMCQFYPEECHWECEHIINFDPYYPPEMEYECFEVCYPFATRVKPSPGNSMKGGGSPISRIIQHALPIRTGKQFRMKFKDVQQENPSSDLIDVYDRTTRHARKVFAISQSCISNELRGGRRATKF